MKMLYRTLACLLCVGSCKHPHQSATKALVTPEQLQAAEAIVGGIDYLPFHYIEDGCRARAMYMSLELAAQKIPSSSAFIEGELNPSHDVSWRFHTAPLLVVKHSDGSAGAAHVLDPGFALPSLTLDAWIDRASAVSTRSLIDSYYYVPGSTPYSSERTPFADTSRLVKSFDDMPPFSAKSIANACADMIKYLRLEQDPREDDKVLRLLARSEALTAAVKALGKLDETEPLYAWEEKVCANAVHKGSGASLSKDRNAEPAKTLILGSPLAVDLQPGKSTTVKLRPLPEGKHAVIRSDADFLVTMSVRDGSRAVDRDLDGKHLVNPFTIFGPDDYPRLTISPKGAVGGRAVLTLTHAETAELTPATPDLTLNATPGVLTYAKISVGARGVPGLARLKTNGSGVYLDDWHNDDVHKPVKDLRLFLTYGGGAFLYPPAQPGPLHVSLTPTPAVLANKGHVAFDQHAIKGTLASAMHADVYDFDLPPSTMTLAVTFRDRSAGAEPYCCWRIEAVAGDTSSLERLAVSGATPVREAAVSAERGDKVRMLVSYAGPDVPTSDRSGLDYELTVAVEAANRMQVCRANGGKGTGPTSECEGSRPNRPVLCATDDEAGDAASAGRACVLLQ